MNTRNDNLIFGRNPVKEALRSNRVKSLFLANNFSFKEILSLVDEKKIAVTYKSVKELDSMCGGLHQGVAAFIRDYEYYSLDSVLERAKKQEKPLIVILDGINSTLRSRQVRLTDIQVIHFHSTAFSVISQRSQLPDR